MSLYLGENLVSGILSPVEPTRNVGQIIQSTVPLTDAGLHLLDGSVINGSGMYADFVTYIAELYETNPTASYFSQDGDVSFSQPTLTSDGTMGGDSFAVSASAESSTYEVYKAFDNDSSTYWRSGTTSGWLQFYNPVPVKVTKLTWGYYYSYPTGGDVQGSNDGSTWTTLKTWSNSSATDFDIDLRANTEYYKYYRINITGVNTDVIHCKQIYIVGYTYITAEANWQSSVISYGVCGKFVYDSVNNTVRLPKITGFIESTTDLTTLGELTIAGLPNITGTFQDGNEYGSTDQMSGAFYRTNLGGHTPYSGNGSPNRAGFDASRSNPIYGRSDTVQPQSVKVLYYIVIATTIKTQIEVDIDEIATDLNEKVDKNDLVSVHCVVETYVNDTSWYRVWSDGWCEQGGAWGTNVSGWSESNVTFLKSFSNTNYQLFVQGNWSDAASSSCKVTARSTTGFTGTYANNLYSVMPSWWYACGYI